MHGAGTGVSHRTLTGNLAVPVCPLGWGQAEAQLLRQKVGGDHAAAWETSYLWYLRPDCVDMSVYLGRSKEPLLGVGDGGFGDLDAATNPRKAASIEKGRKACRLIVDEMIKKAKELIDRVDRAYKEIA